MSGEGYRSSLGRFAATCRDPDPQAPKRMAERAWKDMEMVVLRREDLSWDGGYTDWLFIAAVADRVHGKRAK